MPATTKADSHETRHDARTLRAPYRMLAHRIGRLQDDIVDAAAERAHQARRVARHGRRMAQDSLDQTVLRVRKHPARSLAIAFVAGALTSIAAALAIRQYRRR